MCESSHQDDLPPTDGKGQRRLSYSCGPLTSYQRLLRKGSPEVRYHYCPLNQKRIELVPTNPGSDWRDLPNTVVELEDGTITSCADGERSCEPACRQEGTVIPWFLPHRATRYWY